TDGSQYMRHNNLHASAWGYIFRRKILLDLRFTPGLLHEDEEFTPLLILRAEKIYSTNIVAYFYRKRPSSIMHEKNKKHILKRLDDLEYIIMHLNEKAALLPLNDRNALQRRVAQLTMDYLFNIIKLTRSSKQLDMRIERLKDKGLFPLPDNSYTKKYTVFRLLSNNKILRRLACRAFQLADLS
ncbi:MAG: glycosyltransferase family 2 protein, partial [Prevotellaceae bacterium]|nr:glycosyltransferase family 2 protein [Prevotellaceae bacterium]